MADALNQLGSSVTSAIDAIITQPLYFQDTAKAAVTGLLITAFAGFKWQVPRELNLATFEYSNYTYYNEEIADCVVEKQNTITVTAMRELSFLNNYTTNIVTNNVMVKTIKKYAKSGGLFVLITPAGIIKDLALENLSVSFSGTNPNPLFVFKFRKLVISAVGTQGIVVSDRASFCI